MILYDAKSWIGVLLQFRGTIVTRLMPRVLGVGCIGVLAAYLYAEYHFKMPTTIHTLIGVALGLLLVFRTNTSYDRYWEGRKLFGSITNRSRDLARQFNTFIPGDAPEDRSLRSRMQRLLVVWYRLMCQELRQENDLGKLGVVLTESERSALGSVSSRPALAVQWMSALLVEAIDTKRLPSYCIRNIDVNLQGLLENWGGASRILNTPVPFAYAHHIKAFLAVFCLTVPFVLTDAMKWSTPLVSMVVAYALFGIEEIGVEIEDPFGRDPNDLPLDQIGDELERDTRQLLDARDKP